MQLENTVNRSSSTSLYDVVRDIVGEKTAKYIEDGNKDNLLFLNIESMPAVEILDQLVSIPGVDGVFIGPHDLSVSMNCPTEWDNPD